MSLEDLLSQDSVTVLDRTATRDAEGGPTYGTRPPVFSGVNGRIVSLSSQDQLAWAQLNITATYKFITQKDGIKGGMMLQSSDGRLLRVEGIRRIQTMGTIATYFEYGLNLVSAGG